MKKFFLLMLCITSVLTANAQKSMVFNLWPKGAITESSDRQDTAKVFVYLPDAKHATGRAVVICPGGAYQFLAMGYVLQQAGHCCHSAEIPYATRQQEGAC